MKEGFYLNKDLNFEYIEDFAEYIIKKIEADDELFATVVCKFEEAKDIIKYLMMVEDIDFENIYLESPDEKGYADEFCIELWCNDDVINFSCSPLKVDGKYENPCGDETYLFSNCSSKIIPLCEGSKVYFVSIEDEYDYDEKCSKYCSCGCSCDDSCVEYSKTDDGELHGFTASKSTDNGYHSYSFYTSDSLSKGDIRDILKEFGF